MCITVAGNFRNEGKKLVECLQQGQITGEHLQNVKTNNPCVQREFDAGRTSLRHLEEVAIGYLNGAKVLHRFREEGPGRVVFACRLYLLGPLAFVADLVDYYGDKIFKWRNSNFSPQIPSLCGV
eukprot:GHVT01021635.1.p1 GENE.GHVT01021635.1~~GHVT01021635.1.p1  ORF type:complete len:124 (+),score=4.71 GHVT01021635.1:465-836(+)